MNLSENKKRIYLGVVIILFVIIAILGYAFEKKKEPIRVAFDTKGGGIIFDHRMHASLKNTQCSECHHNYEEGKNNSSFIDMNCRECHYNKELMDTCKDAAIHKRCIGKNCLSCHLEGTVQCNFCHNAENFKHIEQPQKVEFKADAGLVVFDHFSHSSADGYDLECKTCHHGFKPESKNFPMNCRRCHYNKKYESLCKNEETHIRCIGKNCVDCHEDGKEDCAICHKEE